MTLKHQKTLGGWEKLVTFLRQKTLRGLRSGRVNKSKMMLCSRQMDGWRLNMSSNEMLEEVEHVKYLASQIDREGEVEVDVSLGVGEARRAAGTARKLWKNGDLGVEAKMLYEGIVVPIALYGSETWGLRETEKMFLLWAFLYNDNAFLITLLWRIWLDFSNVFWYQISRKRLCRAGYWGIA